MVEPRLGLALGVITLLMVSGISAEVTNTTDVTPIPSVVEETEEPNDNQTDSENKTGYQVPAKFNEFNPNKPTEISDESFQYSLDKQNPTTSGNVTLEFRGMDTNQEFIFGFVSEGEFLPVKNFTSTPVGASKINYDFRPVERDITFDYDKGGYQHYLYYPNGEPAYSVDFYSGIIFHDFDSISYEGIESSNNSLDIYRGSNVDRDNNADVLSGSYTGDSYKYSHNRGFAVVGADIEIESNLTDGETILLKYNIDSDTGTRKVSFKSGGVGLSSNWGDRARIFEAEMDFENNRILYEVYEEGSNDIIKDGEIITDREREIISLTTCCRATSYAGYDAMARMELHSYSVVPSTQDDFLYNPVTYNSTEYNFNDYRIQSENNIELGFRNKPDSEFDVFFPEGKSDYMEIRNTNTGDINFLEYRIDKSNPNDSSFSLFGFSLF